MTDSTAQAPAAPSTQSKGECQSMGEYRVGTKFNPSGDGVVDAIKRAAANLIDLIDGIASDRTTERGNEAGRLKALAQTAIEEGAMWAVKAATKREPGEA